jgi:beta-glucosidase
VSLAPGRTRTVTLHVVPRQLSYWSTAAQQWASTTGWRTVSVGGSSRSLALHTVVQCMAGP